jgi:hypothetical protein
MAFRFKDISREQILSALMLVAVLALASLTNHLLEKQPERDTQLVGMATLKGHGSLPVLHDVMNSNGDLTDMVMNLSAIPAPDAFIRRTMIDQLVVDILFRWAGVETIPAQSFGPFIDARVAGFLKAIGAIPVDIQQGMMITVEEAGPLNKMWFQAFEHYRIRLLAQVIGKQVFQGGIKYDLGSDNMTVMGPLIPKFIEQFDASLQASANSGEAVRNLLDFIDQTRGFNNLTTEEQDLIMSMKVTPPEEQGAEQGQDAAQATPPLPGSGTLLAPPVAASADAQTVPQNAPVPADPSLAP